VSSNLPLSTILLGLLRSSLLAMGLGNLLKGQVTHGVSGYTAIQTMFKVLREASEMLERVPYVKAPAGIINQILKVADVCA
jgi:hypothetical protein